MLKWLGIISVSVLLSWQTPAFAGSDVAATTTDVVTRMQDEGFTVTKISKTWLGRILVTAHNDEFLREVVFNRRSGDILHDSLFNLPGNDTRFASPDPSGLESNEQMTSVGRAQGQDGNQAGAVGASSAEQASASSDNSTDTAGRPGTDTDAASTDATADTGDTDTGDTDTGDADVGDTDVGDTGTDGDASGDGTDSKL